MYCMYNLGSGSVQWFFKIAGPVQNSTIYIGEYTYNDTVYSIHATMEDHHKLSTGI